MKYQEPSPDDYLLIAEKVRSGEYFREARAMYDVSVNDPMAERYFYLSITGVALLTMLFAFFAMQSLYPLSRSVPFVYALNDVLEDMPSIAPLRQSHQQTAHEAVLFFLAKTYVELFEGYAINKIDRDYSGVRHHSAPEVFAQYQQRMQTGNPESPVILYQRHTTRIINVLSVRAYESPANTLEVVYEAIVANAEGSSKTRHKAVLSYTFSGVEIDEKTDKVKPLSFTVTRYSSKIQETP